MKTKSIFLIPAAMLLAVVACPHDASAHNFPGWQAHPLFPNEAGCWSGAWSALVNTCTGGPRHLILPLMGNNGGGQSLTATVSTAGNIMDARCQWVSNDPTDTWHAFTPFVSASASSGTSTISLSMGVFDPGSSYLDCALAQNAALHSVIWTM